MTSIYIHIPFCVKRCAYCDFITYAGAGGYKSAYISALVREIELLSNSQSNKISVNSIYIGGGTPSLLDNEEFTRVFTGLNNSFLIEENTEITVEANPGTLDLEKLRMLNALGVNRISLGVQSFIQNDLIKLGRIHTVEDVFSSIQMAHKSGFTNLNLDLIFGLPWQTLHSWKYNLESLLILRPEHLSLYDLTLEPNTLLTQWVNKGLYKTPDQDLAADMYMYAIERLEKEGYSQYEISNWARNKKYESFHNKQYWLNAPYLGIGAGAHSYINHLRLENQTGIADYIFNIEQCNAEIYEFPISQANINTISCSTYDEMQDTMMLGLRMVRQGVSNNDFCNRFGTSIEDVFCNELQQLLSMGLIEWVVGLNDKFIKLTRRGTLLGNQVFMRFVGD